VSGTKEAFDLPLASTNRVRSFHPWRDLGSFLIENPAPQARGWAIFSRKRKTLNTCFRTSHSFSQRVSPQNGETTRASALSLAGFKKQLDSRLAIPNSEGHA